MASLAIRLASRALKPNVLIPCRTYVEKLLPDPMELATGLEKRELLAKLAGNDDPFQMKMTRKGAGTKESPSLVPSAFDARIVGCVCEEDATCITWMWLHKGSPKRCECGHWYKLTEAKPI